MQFSSILKSLILMVFIISVGALTYKKLDIPDTNTTEQLSTKPNRSIDQSTVTDNKPAVSTPDRTFSKAHEQAPSLQDILTLRAIVPAEGNYDASAYIQFHSGIPVYFFQGNSIFNIAALEEIHHDHVVVSYKGKYVTLPLIPDEVELGDETPTENTQNTGLTNYNSIAEQAALIAARLRNSNNKNQKKVSIRHERKFKYVEYTEHLLDQERDKSLREMTNEAWAFIQYEPNQLQDKISGITLSGVGVETGFLNKHGLEPGDVITSFNGIYIDSQDAISEGINTLGEGKPVELTIERGGQKEIIIINK